MGGAGPLWRTAVRWTVLAAFPLSVPRVPFTPGFVHPPRRRLHVQVYPCRERKTTRRDGELDGYLASGRRESWVSQTTDDDRDDEEKRMPRSSSKGRGLEEPREGGSLVRRRRTSFCDNHSATEERREGGDRSKAILRS